MVLEQFDVDFSAGKIARQSVYKLCTLFVSICHVLLGTASSAIRYGLCVFFRSWFAFPHAKLFRLSFYTEEKMKKLVIVSIAFLLSACFFPPHHHGHGGPGGNGGMHSQGGGHNGPGNGGHNGPGGHGGHH